MSLTVEQMEFLQERGLSLSDVIEFARLNPDKPRSPAAERQARYRARQKAGNVTGDVTRDVTNDVTQPPLSRPPNENNSNPPTHTPPDTTPRARDANFPRPDWAPAPLWADFLTNRKRKRLPNTPTAYQGFLADIARLQTAQWPPGRLLEHATRKGWGAIYPPDEMKETANGAAIRGRSTQGTDRRSSLARACDEALANLGG